METPDEYSGVPYRTLQRRVGTVRRDVCYTDCRSMSVILLSAMKSATGDGSHPPTCLMILIPCTYQSWTRLLLLLILLLLSLSVLLGMIWLVSYAWFYWFYCFYCFYCFYHLLLPILHHHFRLRLLSSPLLPKRSYPPPAHPVSALHVTRSAPRLHPLSPSARPNRFHPLS